MTRRPKGLKDWHGRTELTIQVLTFKPLRAFLRQHYVSFVFSAATAIVVWAVFWVGLWRVPSLLGDLLVALPAAIGDPEETRSIVTAWAAALAAIAILGTIIVQSIRVWTNERTTTTIEQGHVTDRITKAIEQLGSQKTIKVAEIDEAGQEIRDEAGRLAMYERTTPNIEVRARLRRGIPPRVSV